MAKAIMIQGTMSNVGKSLIAAGLCRIFKQDGYKVAPFKSQNMALNSYITKENLEMGRAQVVQAEAAGVEPVVAMNPILLKPTTDMGSQVIINGEVVGNMRAVDYFKKKKEYIPVIQEAYNSLAKEYDIIVIEGAGSPAEINLKQDDIVNMGMAKIADASVLLVGDIDRGGVFAQLVGTVILLEPEEQERICGLIINKFRGDQTILEPGIAMLEERCKKEVLGVVPYADVEIEEEDSLAESLNRKAYHRGIDIAVIRLPKVSNFTDFQALAQEPKLSVRYVEKLSELGKPDVVILPGTKNTIQDMLWLRESGLETAILRLAGSREPANDTLPGQKGLSGEQQIQERKALIIGICGGYQMLGETIADTCNAEGGGTIRGMGLLPIDTCFEPEKIRTRVKGQTVHLDGELAELSGKKVSGYEIHMGKSYLKEGSSRLAALDYSGDFESGDKEFSLPLESGTGGSKTAAAKTNVVSEGCYRDNVMGSYLHGIFDEEEFRQALVRLLCKRKGIAYEKEMQMTFREYKEMQYDKLADILRKSLNMERIYNILGIPKKRK